MAAAECCGSERDLATRARREARPAELWNRKRPVGCLPESGGREAARQASARPKFLTHSCFLYVGGANDIDLLAVDHSARASMKDAASCEK